jgi:hypothetical protein
MKQVKEFKVKSQVKKKIPNKTQMKKEKELRLKS